MTTDSPWYLSTPRRVAFVRVFSGNWLGPLGTLPSPVAPPLGAHQLRAVFAVLGVFFAACLGWGTAEAQPPSSAAWATAPVDVIIQGIINTSTSWQPHMQRAARQIAGMVGIFSFFYQLIQLYRNGQDWVSGGRGVLIGTLLQFGITYVLIEAAPLLAGGIIEFMRGLGVSAAGADAAYRPQDMVVQGLQVYANAIRSIDPLNIAISLAIAGSAGIVLILYCLIAAFMTLALVQLYVVASAGVFALGFAVSPHTSAIAKSYFKFLLAAGTKLLVMMLIVSTGNGMTRVWARMAGTPGAYGNLELLCVVLASLCILLAMVVSLPAYVSSLVAGSTEGSEGLVKMAAATMAMTAVTAATGGSSAVLTAASSGSGTGGGGSSGNGGGNGAGAGPGASPALSPGASAGMSLPSPSSASPFGAPSNSLGGSFGGPTNPGSAGGTLPPSGTGGAVSAAPVAGDAAGAPSGPSAASSDTFSGPGAISPGQAGPTATSSGADDSHPESGTALLGGDGPSQ